MLLAVLLLGGPFGRPCFSVAVVVWKQESDGSRRAGATAIVDDELLTPNACWHHEAVHVGC
jgi:hypothetical protein